MKISECFGVNLIDDWFMLILMKIKPPIHIMAFGEVTSDGDVKPPFLFSHGHRLNTETCIKCIEEVVLPWSRERLLEYPTSGNRTLHHATQAEETRVSSEKISATTSALTSGHLTSQNAISLIIMSRVKLSKRPMKIRVTPKMNWR